MNPLSIKKYYSFLAHQNETEVRAIIPKTNVVRSIFCNSKEEFVNACKKFEGTHNIYAGLNERRKGGKEDDDVEFITNIGHDVDCHVEGSSLEVGKKVCEKYVKEALQMGLREPLLMCSGRGFWIIHHIKPLKNTPENRQKIKIFGAKIKSLYQEEGVDFDSKVYNPSRIARVSGTTNISDPSNLCESYLLNNPSGEEDSLFTQSIENIKLPVYDDTLVADIPKGNCAFMDYCITHKLPEGERHSIISRNLSLYIYNNPQRDFLKDQYIKTQNGRATELDTWLNSISNHPDKKFPFSCGELIKYQFKYNIPLKCEKCTLFQQKEDLGPVQGWANSVSIVQMAKRYNFEKCPDCNTPLSFKDSHGLYYCPSCKSGGGLRQFATLILKRKHLEMKQ